MTNSTATAALVEGGREIALGGPHYIDVLSSMHERLKPRTYFELGTWRGTSLRVATCASLAVDPDFQLEEGVVGSKPSCVLHQSTSDEFFATRDPAQILGGPVDLAFIDALHIFEYALRDFIGTERSVSKESVIVLDDCCPRDLYMARRSLVPEVVQLTKYEGYWTGDVWKIVPVLREYRPDIELTCIDTTPTGLATCTNLNPEDRSLEARYDEIVGKWRDVALENYGMGRLLDDLRMESADTWVSSLRSLHPGDPTSPAKARPRVRTKSDEIRDLNDQLDSMRRSRSWQITRPLRWLSAITKRS